MSGDSNYIANALIDDDAINDALKGAVRSGARFAVKRIVDSYLSQHFPGCGWLVNTIVDIVFDYLGGRVEEENQYNSSSLNGILKRDLLAHDGAGFQIAACRMGRGEARIVGAPAKQASTRVRVPPVQLDGSAPKTRLTELLQDGCKKGKGVRQTFLTRTVLPNGRNLTSG